MNGETAPVTLLDIGRLERLLLWTARTEWAALPSCTHYTRKSLASLGASLLLASLLMFLALLMAVDATLLPGEMPSRWPLAVLLALMPATGYLFLNRWLLDYAGTSGHSRSLLRILVTLMALGFALAVLPSFEIRLLGGAVGPAATRTTTGYQGSASDATLAGTDGTAIMVPPRSDFAARRAQVRKIRADTGSSFLLVEAILFLALAGLAAMPHLLKIGIENSEYRCLLEVKRRFDEQKRLSDPRTSDIRNI